MAGFDIKGISEKAAREADKTWNRTVGPNESNPEDRVSVGGDQPSDRERFLRSLVTNRTRRAIAGLMIAPFAVSAIYVGAKDFKTGGTRDLDSYEISDEIVKAPSVNTTVRGVSYMEMLETGYVKAGPKLPEDPEWTGITFTGKNGVTGIRDLDDASKLAAVRADVKEARLDTLANSIAIDWAVFSRTAEDKGYDLNDYIRVVARSSIFEARQWGSDGFPDDVARKYGAAPGPVAETPAGQENLTSEILGQLKREAPTGVEPGNDVRAEVDDDPGMSY